MVRSRHSRSLSYTAVTAFLACVLLPFSCHAQASQPELILQYGHTREIVGTPSISPDGRLAATQDGGHEIVVWDLATGQQLRRLRPVLEVRNPFTGAMEHAVDKLGIHAWMRAEFSLDGRLLAASGYGSVTVWEVETGRRLAQIIEQVEGPVGRMAVQTVPDIAFTPDSRSIYMPDFYGGLSVYDVSTGKRVHYHKAAADFLVKYGNMVAIATSADGRIVAGAGRKVTGPTIETHWLRIADVTGRQLHFVEHAANRLQQSSLEQPLASFYAVAVAVSRDGSLVALGGHRSVWLHDSASGRLVRQLDFGEDLATGVAFSPDGQTLAATGSLDYSVRLFDVASGRTLRILANSQTRRRAMVEGFAKVSFSPDGRRIIATTSRGSLRQWDAATGDVLSYFGGRTDAVRQIAASRDAKKLAVVDSTTNELRVWDLENGQRSFAAALHRSGDPVMAVAFTAESREVVSIAGSSELKALDSATGEQRRRFELDSPPAPRSSACPQERNPLVDTRIAGATFSADGRFLAAVSPEACILRVWETATGREVRRIHGLFDKVALSAEGRRLAARMNDRLFAWDVATGTPLATPREKFSVSSIVFFNEAGQVAFSGPSGKDDAAGGTLIVWDLEAGKEVRRYARRVHVEALPRWAVGSGRMLVRGLFEKSRMTMLDLGSGGAKVLTHPATHPSGSTWFDVLSGGCCVAIGGASGEIQLVDLEREELLATLISVRDGTDWAAGSAASSWLVVTPDGLFDGQPESFDRLLWRFSDRLDDVAPGEAFFNEFYRPGLLAEIASGGRPKAPRDIARLDRRQPQVLLRADPPAGRAVKIRLDVTEAPASAGSPQGSGARDVRLFRNGALVKAWRGDVLAGRAQARLEATVTLVAGENRFVAYAFNSDNVKSADASLRLVGAEELRRAGTAWVLAIGVNRYSNPTLDLRYAVADADAFSAQISQAQKALGRHESVQVVSLLDQQATKSNILRALRRLSGQDTAALPKGSPLAALRPAQPEDSVFIFFAGHGLGDDPRFYLVPHDVRLPGSLSQLDATALKEVYLSALSDLELEAALEPLDAGRLVMVIDACHSGQALDSEEKRRGPMNSRGLAQLAYEKGMYILTAAQGHQAALEFASLGHGLLTHALVEEGLRRRAADHAPRDGRVLIREWLDFASAAVPRAQLEAMREAEKRGRAVAVLDRERSIADVLKRTLQQPRVFYRREPEREPFIVEKAGF